MKAMIIALIISGANERNIDPNMALAIAIVESNLNQAAVGGLGELGVFQLRPHLYLEGVSAYDTEGYINRALDLMAEKQRACGKALLPTCWNLGVTGGKRLGLQKALNGPYNTKVRKVYETLKTTSIR